MQTAKPKPQQVRTIKTRGLRLTRRQITKLQSRTHRQPVAKPARAPINARRIHHDIKGKYCPGGPNRNCGKDRINPKSARRAEPALPA